MNSLRRSTWWLIVPAIVLTSIASSSGSAQIPAAIKDPGSSGYILKPEQPLYPLTRSQLLPVRAMRTDSAGKGLILDLGDSTLFGRAYWGQAFFDIANADYFLPMYRQQGEIRKGRVVMTLQGFFEERTAMNANNWTDRGILEYSLELLRISEGIPTTAGTYTSTVHFRRDSAGFHPIVSIVEGPIVALVQSEHPDWFVVAWETDRPSTGAVELQGGPRYASTAPAMRHEVQVTGVRPSHRYTYRVLARAEPDSTWTPWLPVTTAPRKGDGPVAFAFAGDARAGGGGGDYSIQGVNRRSVEELFRHAKRQGSSFVLFGGDMVSGYTNSVESYVQQLKSFKRSIADFTYSAPLYTSVGNHESLIHRFEDGSQYALAMDRWPYATASTEAIVAQEFVQPTNAPPAYEGMPPLRETVYSFQFGMVKVIVLNNAYWWTSHNRIREIGGSPEGYIMPNQLAWAEQELKHADTDPTVRYVIVFAHEPVFPGGAHLPDAMWHGGNNNIRAYRKDSSGIVQPFKEGILDVRNRLWEMCTRSRKVAAFLGSDEHNYQRLYISPKDPVGYPPTDDLNRNGILDDGTMSPVPGFQRELWFLISGGAGAPSYAHQKSPWEQSLRKFSPQNHYVLFRADARTIGIEVYSRSGQLLDRVESLMAREPSR